MSRIDDLIAELCPNGVEFKSVGEVTARSSNIKWANAGDDEFQYIDLSSVDRVTRRIGETASITAGNAPSRAQQIVHTGDVIFATTRPAQMRWAVIPAEYDGQIASTGYCVLRPDTSVILTNFLAHILGADTFRQYIEANQVAGNYPSIPDNRVRAYRIPVPPLEVQREIVRVLDQFTQLEARRRQYEHYRGGLLAFDLEEVEAVELSEAFETRNGYTPSKSDPTNWSNGVVPWFRMEDIRENGRVLDHALQRIPEKAVKGGRLFPAGSLIFATSATIGEHALITVPFMSNQRFTAVWPKSEYVDRFDKKFLYYYGFVIDEWCRNNTSTSSFASVDMSGFKRLRIPIPPIETQERIVSQLDRFDALVNDLSIGLPAELAARRKQYEYYRDKLLTFEEAAA